MKKVVFILFLLVSNLLIGQNSMVGDGFGGRLWYYPTNYGVGSYTAYSLCNDLVPNQLKGWGYNGYNSLGLGTSITGVSVPTSIPNMTNVKYFSSGYIMGVIKNDNTGWAWGNGITTGNPIQVITGVSFLDASSFTISYVKNDGTVWSVGDNTYGQFGNGTTINSSTIPVQMQTITNAIRVSNNWGATIILLSDSTIMSVGSSGFGGELGLGSIITQTLTPLPIIGLPPIVDIKSNTFGTIALSSDGKVYSWGLEYPTGSINYSPVLLSNLDSIIAISGCDDGGVFLALDENKNCYGWGAGGVAIGLPSTGSAYAPTIVATDVIDIMAGENFSYIIKSDGSLWASGLSKNGHSIWLNLPDTQRNIFTQLDPNIVPGTCKIEVTNPVSVKNISVEYKLSIHPNPTSTQFTIEGLNKPYNLIIYNAVGQLLYQENIKEQSKKVDVSRFAKGILFIRIEVEGEVIYQKVVRQ